MPLAFNGSGGYGSAVPFQRVIEPQQLGMFLNLEQAELVRIQRYAEAQRFYLGNHWSFKREDGDPLVTVNYIRKLVDKSVAFLMGAGFTMKVPEPLAQVTAPKLKEVWGYNNGALLGHEIATTGGITGDAFILITAEEPTEMAKRINPHTKGKVRLNLLGSEQVFPTWDPLNKEVLTSVRIETIFYADRGIAKTDRDDRADHQGRQLYTKRFTQIITPTVIVEQFAGEIPVERPNVLGEIPLVHIKNLSMPREYYGLSDVQDLIDLQREFNEKATDISDIINYQAAPVTVIFGARAKNVERGAKQIWSGLPSDARVQTVALGSDLNAAQGYLERIKLALHELSDVPEGSLGKAQPISNTSGVALSMSMFPLVEKTKRKRVTYGLGFEQINYFILRCLAVLGEVALPFDVCKTCGGRIVVTEDPEKMESYWAPDPSVAGGGEYRDRPLRKPRCYHVDPRTMEFLAPEEMRLKYVREYGFGSEVREAPLWMIERELRGGKPSYWDYAADQLKELQGYQEQLAAYEAQNPVPEMQADGTVRNPPPPAPRMKVTLLPAEFVDVPEEPEKVRAVVNRYHPGTGDFLGEQIYESFLVPTGCIQPEYLNPFETEVEFQDVLPKDQALEAQKFMLYQQNGWVDAEWVRRKLPEIAEDALDIEKRMKTKSQVAPQNPGGGFQELAPSSETGAGGDKTPTEGQAEAQQQGAQKKEGL